MQPLDSSLRDPNELNLILESQENWNILEIPIKKIGFITFGPYNLSMKTHRYKPFDKKNSLTFIFNSLSICFILIAIYLRKQYGAL